MALWDVSDRTVFAKTSARTESLDNGNAFTMPNDRDAWPKRLLKRIKERERVRACAYFLSTIL